LGAAEFEVNIGRIFVERVILEQLLVHGGGLGELVLFAQGAGKAEQRGPLLRCRGLEGEYLRESGDGRVDVTFRRFLETLSDQPGYTVLDRRLRRFADAGGRRGRRGLGRRECRRRGGRVGRGDSGGGGSFRRGRDQGRGFGAGDGRGRLRCGGQDELLCRGRGRLRCGGRGRADFRGRGRGRLGLRQDGRSLARCNEPGKADAGDKEAKAGHHC